MDRPRFRNTQEKSKDYERCGCFITWLQDDMVNDITSFRGRNGGTAMWLV